MSTGTWVTIALAVLGFLLGLLGAAIGFAIRTTLSKLELQFAHLKESFGKDDTRMDSSIRKLQVAIDEAQEEGRAADTYLGTIVANLAEQVAVLRTILEERFGRSTSSARFPKVKQPSEPPAFLPPEARVVVRQTPTGTGVESSGRYAAYVPHAPPRPKEPKR